MKQKWAAVFACGVIIIGGCATAPRDGADMTSVGIVTGFINKTVLVDSGERSYVVYVPRDYDPGKPWPLIVFLHGRGQRGDDGLRQTEVGIGRAVRLWPERFPCLIVMPQCPESGLWDIALDQVDAALERTMAEYNVNRDRVYLTGLSIGGYATWIYGAMHIDTYAALMPICGGGNPEDAATLAQVPIWAFHGAEDPAISPEESRTMVEAVQQAGGSVKYTEYPETGHNAWDQAYGDKKAIKWLLKQRKAH